MNIVNALARAAASYEQRKSEKELSKRVVPVIIEKPIPTDERDKGLGNKIDIYV